MPFASQAQRAMFWKAKSDPAFRKAKGLKLSTVKEMTGADDGGKLPARAKPQSRGEKWYGTAGA